MDLDAMARECANLIDPERTSCIHTGSTDAECDFCALATEPIADALRRVRAATLRDAAAAIRAMVRTCGDDVTEPVQPASCCDAVLDASAAAILALDADKEGGERGLVHSDEYADKVCDDLLGPRAGAGEGEGDG